jgi:hypothetical protein
MPLDEHIPAEWRGRIPPLFRYMKQEYVEAFFARGELWLTTYERCRAIDDLSRNDAREGKINTLVRTTGDYAIASVSGVGRQSYMLCTSLHESEALMSSFEAANDYFRIDDPRAFAETIASAVNGYQRGLMGPCTYMPERSVEKYDPSFLPDFSKILELGRSGDEAGAIKAVEEFHKSLSENHARFVGQIPYFAKVAGSHQDEREFRFVWIVDHPTGNTMLPLVVPEATKYCSRRPAR